MTRATTICLFCVSPLEELRRTVNEGNGLLNTFEGLGGALRALSLTSLSRAPIGQNCLLCPVTPKIVSILDRICNLEEQVDRLTSNRDAMMGDLLNDCNLVKEELQSILEKYQDWRREFYQCFWQCQLHKPRGYMRSHCIGFNFNFVRSTTLPPVITRRLAKCVLVVEGTTRYIHAV